MHNGKERWSQRSRLGWRNEPSQHTSYLGARLLHLLRQLSCILSCTLDEFYLSAALSHFRHTTRRTNMHTTDSDLSSKSKPSVLRSIFTRSSSSASNDRIPQSGDLIQLDGFGGSFELTDGQEATLKNLLDISIGGVILFTYPKANTPGCK